MTDTNETYEQLRALLSPQGFQQLPKHEQTGPFRLAGSAVREWKEPIGFLGSGIVC